MLFDYIKVDNLPKALKEIIEYEFAFCIIDLNSIVFDFKFKSLKFMRYGSYDKIKNNK